MFPFFFMYRNCLAQCDWCQQFWDNATTIQCNTLIKNRWKTSWGSHDRQCREHAGGRADRISEQRRGTNMQSQRFVFSCLMKLKTTGWTFLTSDNEMRNQQLSFLNSEMTSIFGYDSIWRISLRMCAIDSPNILLSWKRRLLVPHVFAYSSLFQSPK